MNPFAWLFFADFPMTPMALLGVGLIGWDLRGWRDRGYRCRWLARLTHGRHGLGTWTQDEIDVIQARAKRQHEEFQRYVD